MGTMQITGMELGCCWLMLAPLARQRLWHPRGDGADLRANTCRAQHRENKGDDVWVGGRGARRVTRPPYLPPLFAPRLSQSLQDAKVQGEAAQRRLGQDDPGAPPLPAAGLPGTTTEGWRLKSRQIAGLDLRLVILRCASWLMSNEGLGRRPEEGAGWAHPWDPAGKGLLPRANPQQLPGQGERAGVRPPPARGRGTGAAAGRAGWQEIPLLPKSG